jgi:uncharacterized protein (DUF2062 family)
MISYNTLKEKFRHILHLGDPPRRTALAFSVGAFIAFTPTYGLHFVTAFLCAWLFRLNLVALIAGTLLNNPWTVLPIIGSSIWVGLLLAPVGQPPNIDWSNFTFQMLWDQLGPFVVPFVLGHTILGIVAAVIGYVLAHQAIQRFRAHQARTKHLAPPPPSC